MIGERELNTREEVLEFYYKRRDLWLDLDPEYREIWDYAEKRVISNRLINDQPIILRIAAVLHNALLYRKRTWLNATGAAPSGDISHIIMKLSVRQDHDRQLETISRELSPEYIISDEGWDLEYIAQISVGLATRASLLARSVARACRISLAGLAGAGKIPDITNMLLKYYLDKNVGNQIAEHLPDTGRRYLVSSLTVENHRGLIPPLRQNGVKFAAYQHGIRGDNGGFPEETSANICVLWTSRDKDMEHSNVGFRPPPELAVCPTLEHADLVRQITAQKDSTAKPRITYLSSPSMSYGKDRDRDMMYELARRMSTEDDIPFELTFCLHPSKTVSDYPGLSSCKVVVGLSQVSEPQTGYIGIFSTALVFRALEGARVATLRRRGDVPDPRTEIPGLPVVYIETLPGLSGLLDDDGISPISDRAKFASNIFGVFRKGELKKLLAKLYNHV